MKPKLDSQKIESIGRNIPIIFQLSVFITSCIFITFFLAILIGPQTCHYINLTLISLSLLLLIFTVSNIILKQIISLKVILTILALIFNLAVSAFLISFRYGYSNWNYYDLFHMQYENPSIKDYK